MALLKERLGIDAAAWPGRTGQFDVIADGKKIVERGGNWFSRMLGAGYPDFDSVVDRLARHRTDDAAREPAGFEPPGPVKCPAPALDEVGEVAAEPDAPPDPAGR